MYAQEKETLFMGEFYGQVQKTIPINASSIIHA
jgi:hypothetical protein